MDAGWPPHRVRLEAGRRDTTPNLFWQRADGAGEIQRLTDSKNQQIPGSWHPSGKFLAFTEQNPQTGLRRDDPADGRRRSLRVEARHANGLPERPLHRSATRCSRRTGGGSLTPPTSPGVPKCTCDRFLARAASGRSRLTVEHNAYMVANSTRTVLPNARQPDHGRLLHCGRRLIPRREAAALVGGAFHAEGARTAMLRPAPGRRHASRWQRSWKRRPNPSRIRSSSSSTSSTSCAGLPRSDNDDPPRHRRAATACYPARSRSARRKNTPSVTTRSPGSRPVSTGTRPPVGSPTSTFRSMNRPGSSLRAT